MQSWRINTIFDNRSQKVLPSPGTGLGASVVRSTKGPEELVYLGRGETLKIINLFGSPKTDNPELLEAIEYNKFYPMYLSSVAHRGKAGGFILTTSGTLSLGATLAPQYFSGVSPDISTVDFSDFNLYTPLETEDGEIYQGVLGLTYADTDNDHLADFLKVDESNIPTTFSLLIEGEETVLTLSETAGVYDISGSGITSGTFTLETGVIQIEFTSGSEPESTDVVEVLWSADFSDAYAFFMSKGISDSYYLKAKTIRSTMDGASGIVFETSLEMKNPKGDLVSLEDSPFVYSNNIEDEDGFGRNIFMENVFDNSDYFKVFSNPAITSATTFTDDTESVIVSSGFRGGAVTGEDYTRVYDKFKEVKKYPVDLFFDATQNDTIPTIFSDLRTNYHKYSRFTLPVPDMTIAEALDWTLPVSDRGISFYYGYFYIRNNYGSVSKLRSIPMGEVAKKHADIMMGAFGGLAPAWFDENGMGGQLTSGRLIETIYDPTEDQLQLMDEARINPIILNPSFGPLIASRRTSFSGSLSDWSFIDYSGAMDYILRNLSEQVLPFQLVKMNDPIHRNIVRTKTNSILSPMTVVPRNVVREYAIKCDSENNNDEVLAREEFRLDIAVKFTPKSRTIVLTFINTPQGSSVEEMFE
jgi:hypothetical protein